MMSLMKSPLSCNACNDKAQDKNLNTGGQSFPGNEGGRVSEFWMGGTGPVGGKEVPPEKQSPSLTVAVLLRLSKLRECLTESGQDTQ